MTYRLNPPPDPLFPSPFYIRKYMKNTVPRIGLTMGDPNGIGAEMIIKALQQMQPSNTPSALVFGDLTIMNEVAHALKSHLRFIPEGEPCRSDNEVSVLDLGVQHERNWELGTLSSWAGESAFTFLSEAIRWAKEGKIDAITTGPLCKESLHAAGHIFPGHTEILSHQTNQATPVMMLTVDGLRAVHVTAHMALREAIERLNPELIVHIMEVAVGGLKQLGIENPRLGVPGLNPHAGENGLFGDEEQKIIIPAIEKAREKGILCEGPIPPDVIFLQHREGRFDAVVALYHDQAHVALKLLGFDRGVNVTLGLPIIRTSVDHGTAFDRAPLFNSDPSSMIHAIRMAKTMATHRTHSI